jgi:hypothetical protein
MPYARMQWTAPLHCDLIFAFSGTRLWNKNPEPMLLESLLCRSEPEPCSVQGPSLLQQTLRKKWEQTRVKNFCVSNLSKDFSLSATGGEGLPAVSPPFYRPRPSNNDSPANQAKQSTATSLYSFKAYIVQQQMTIF